MRRFATMQFPSARTSAAPDGSDVRDLRGWRGGGMAHFELAAGETSTAVAHRSVEEIWMFVSGSGEMWRRQGPREETVPVEAGVCVTIPLGTQFQFRSFGPQALGAIA